MWYVGQGSEREQLYLLRSLPVFSHFPGYPQSNWALLVLIPGWVGFCMFWDPVGLSNELSCEAGSFSHCCFNPHRCFQSEVWGFISLHWNPGLHNLSRSPVVSPGLSTRKCGTARFANRSLTRAGPLVLQLPPCCESCPPWLPVSAHLTGLGISSLTSWLSDFIQFDFLAVLGVFCFSICCCPSFGCMRKQSVSTYASILAGSLFVSFKC